MEEMLSMIEKRRRNRRSKDPRMEKARQNIKMECEQVNEDDDINEIARNWEQLKKIYNSTLEANNKSKQSGM
jgi:hypothetical protein